MYIQQAFKGLHEWWRYLIGTILIFIIWFSGQIPHAIAIMSKAFTEKKDLENVDPYELMGLLDSNLNFFLLLFSFLVGAVGIIFVVKILHKQSVLNLTTSRSKVDWKRIFLSFILWGSVTAAMILIEYFTQSENYKFNFQLKPFLILAAIGICLVPIQTSFEEYLFRGYILQGLGAICKNRWFPLIFTSTAFGLMHIFNPEIDKLGYVLLVHYIGTGFFLGILVLMDEGLELSLGFHAANNLVAALLVTADWTAFQTNSVLKDISNPEVISLSEVFVPILIIYPLFLFIFSKMYQWTNWKQRLFGKVTNPTTT